jgi:cystathionine beta-synthase
MEGDVDAVVVGVGSGGTLTGIGRYLKKASPKTAMVLADPAGSILAPLVETGQMTEAGSWAVEGIGEDFVPPNCDLSLVKKAYSIGDKESFSAARELLRKEGILAGSSSGTLLAAALRYCREQTEPKRVVTLVCDTGAKYLSKVFNDAFIAQEGWLDRKTTGTARDVVINPFGEGATIFVSPSETLRSAFARMRSSDISQLPVIEDGHVVGLIDESDILDALVANEGAPQSVFDKPVRDVMVSRLQTISADAPVKELLPLFAAGLVPVIMDGDTFVGLATRIDLINFFRIKAS